MNLWDFLVQGLMTHLELILTLAVFICLIFYIVDGLSYRKIRHRLLRRFRNHQEDAQDRQAYEQRLRALPLGRLRPAQRALVERIQQQLDSGEPLAEAHLYWLKRPCDAKEKLVEFFSGLFWVLFVVWFVRSFLFEPFKIPSGSMEPNLYPGDFILTNKFAYGVRLPVLHTKIIPVGTPQRGDVMVFRYPNNPSIDYIKRVIGLPGDKIHFDDGVVTVNGKVQKLTLKAEKGFYDWYQEALQGHPHLLQFKHDALLRERGQGTFIVPKGQYFVMGDNRDDSQDGRIWNQNNPLSPTPWGFVPEQNIVGKALFIWMNSNCITLKGSCGRIGKGIH